MGKTLLEKDSEQVQVEHNGYMIALSMLMDIAQDKAKSATDRVEACRLLVSIQHSQRLGVPMSNYW